MKICNIAHCWHVSPLTLWLRIIAVFAPGRVHRTCCRAECGKTQLTPRRP